MRKQTKLVAVLSAAALLAIGASMTSFAASGWQEEDGSWVYLDKYGDRVYDEWKKSGNQYFFLDENGEMATEKVINDDDNIYYVDANGARVTNQWVSVDNEDDVEVAGNEVTTLWYYFGSNGKAFKSDSGLKVKEIVGTEKLKYAFTDEGHMASGWQTAGEKEDLYYFGDENQGWALTGWQHVEPDGDLTNEEYDDAKWFYFDGGKAVKNKVKFIKGAYYTFNEYGVMADDWMEVATPPSASGANSYASEPGAIGSGWVYTTAPGDDDGDSQWFYLVNVKDGNKTVARGVPFNYKAGPDEYAAKYIKNKTYLFGEGGKMITGVKTLSDLAAGDGGKELKAGIYYFNKADGSVKGQMVTGKATVETDGEKAYYYFNKDGRAVTSELKDGSIYLEDGTRLNAEDGSTYAIETVSGITNGKETISGDVIVSSSGKVKKSGTVKIDGELFTVTNYIAAPKKDK